MDLGDYVRQHLNNKWAPFVKKDYCEKCGSNANLELHHIDEFVKLLDNTLVLLDLDYKDTTEYTKDELKLIRLVMQGKHLDVRTKTLCLDCHNELHSKKDKKYKPKLKKIKPKPTSKDILMNEMAKIQDSLEYRQELIDKKIINERGIRKKDLRALCGIKARQTWVRAINDKDFQSFVQKRGIVISDKGHYIDI